jgi:hypothetical protein
VLTGDDLILQQDLSDLDYLLFESPKGLMQSRMTAFQLLQKHRNDLGGAADQLASEVRAQTTVTRATAPCSWDVPTGLAADLIKIRQDRYDLPPRDATREIVKSADSVITQSDQLLTAAYATESLLLPAAVQPSSVSVWGQMQKRV